MLEIIFIPGLLCRKVTMISKSFFENLMTAKETKAAGLDFTNPDRLLYMFNSCTCSYAYVLHTEDQEILALL